MAEKQIIDYINQSREQGVSDTEIKQELLGAKWDESYIDEAFVELGGEKADIKKIVLLSILAVSVLIIIAVGIWAMVNFSQTSQKSKDGQTNTSQDELQETMTNEQKSELEKCDRFSKEYRKDGCFRDFAVKHNHYDTCNLINDGYIKAWCLKEIAVNNSDETICNEIKSTYNQMPCLIQVAMKKKDDSLCQPVRDFQKETDSVGAYFSIYLSHYYEIELDDILYMHEDKLEEPGSKSYCDLMVAITKMPKRNFCLPYDSDERPYCEFIYEVLTDSRNHETTCLELFGDPTLIEDEDDRRGAEEFHSACYGLFAVAYNNIDACHKISDNYLRDDCYGQIAASTYDANVCLLIDKVSDEEDCLESLARRTFNINICDLIDNDDKRQRCIDNLKNYDCDDIPDYEVFAQENCKKSAEVGGYVASDKQAYEDDKIKFDYSKKLVNFKKDSDTRYVFSGKVEQGEIAPRVDLRWDSSIDNLDEYYQDNKDIEGCIITDSKISGDRFIRQDCSNYKNGGLALLFFTTPMATFVLGPYDMDDEVGPVRDEIFFMRRVWSNITIKNQPPQDPPSQNNNQEENENSQNILNEESEDSKNTYEDSQIKFIYDPGIITIGTLDDNSYLFRENPESGQNAISAIIGNPDINPDNVDLDANCEISSINVNNIELIEAVCPYSADSSIMMYYNHGVYFMLLNEQDVAMVTDEAKQEAKGFFIENILSNLTIK